MKRFGFFVVLFACATTSDSSEKGAVEPELVSIPTPVEPRPQQLVLADLSGVVNGKWVTKNIAVGGALEEGTLPQLAEGGIARIINLRGSGEMSWDEAGKVEAHGMAYVHLPISSVTDFTPEFLDEFDRLIGEDVSTLVHCASGNRVGAAFALHAQKHGGASVDDAMELGRRHGLTSLSQPVRERLDQAAE